MKISIVICTRNRKELLTQLLTCLKYQTRLPDQLIIVENTTEGQAFSQLALEKIFVGKNININYVTCQSINIPISRNLALKYIKGDISFFIDDDVTFSKHTLQQITEFFKTQKKVNSVCGKFYTEEKSIFAQFTCNFFNSSNYKITGDTVAFSPFAFIVFRSKAIKNLRFHELYNVTEDVTFMAEFRAKGYSCVFMPEIKIYHNFLRGNVINFFKRFYQYHRTSIERCFHEAESHHLLQPLSFHRKVPHLLLPFTLSYRLLKATLWHRIHFNLKKNYFLPIFSYYLIFIWVLIFTRYGRLTLSKNFIQSRLA